MLSMLVTICPNLLFIPPSWMLMCYLIRIEIRIGVMWCIKIGIGLIIGISIEIGIRIRIGIEIRIRTGIRIKSKISICIRIWMTFWLRLGLYIYIRYLYLYLKVVAFFVLALLIWWDMFLDGHFLTLGRGSTFCSNIWYYLLYKMPTKIVKTNSQIV